MKRVTHLAGFLVLSLMATVSKADLIQCGSSGYRYNSCPTNVSVREVVLRRQLSNSPCTLGASWGYESSMIWVDKGCEATFETIQDYGHEPGYGHPPRFQDREQQLQCGSQGYRYSTCGPSYPGQIVSFQIIRQLSNSPCLLGRTFGASLNSIWVDRGCEGIFRVITRVRY